MSQESLQVDSFCREVASLCRLWTIKGKKGVWMGLTPSGVHHQLFWSSLARVERIIRNAPPDWGNFKPFELTWDWFSTTCVPVLRRNGVKMGVNWGDQSFGYLVDLETVVAKVQQYIAQLAAGSRPA